MKRVLYLLSVIVVWSLMPSNAYGRWVKRLDNIKEHVHSNIGLEHGWLICDISPDTSTYLWQKISQGDFCYDYCKEKSNSWKDGWPRSQCRSACWAAYAPSSHFYKCWDPEPVLKEWTEAANKELKKDYDDFKNLYRQKEAASQTSDELALLTVNVMKMRLEKERAQNKLNYLKDLKVRVDAALKEYAEPQKRISAEIYALLKEVDTLSLELEKLIKTEGDAVKNLVKTSQDFIGKLFKRELQNPRKSYDDLIGSADFKAFCVEKRTQSLLREIRGKVSKAWLATESYEIITRDLANFIAITPNGEASAKLLSDSVSQIRETVRKYETNVFVEPLESIYNARVICEDLLTLSAVVDMRTTATSLEERVKEIEESRQLSSIKLNIRLKIEGVEAQLTSAIINGELNEIVKAREAGAWVSKHMKVSLGNREIGDNQELKSMFDDVAARGEKMKKEADESLTLERMNGLLCKRIKIISGRMKEAEEEIPTDHPLRANLKRNVVDEFEALIKRGPFGRMRCPIRSTKKEYLELDGKFAVIDRELGSIREEISGGHE